MPLKITGSRSIPTVNNMGVPSSFVFQISFTMNSLFNSADRDNC